MNTRWMIPTAALAGGFAAFCLRLAQNRTGYDGDLPIPGHPAAIVLPLLLAILCVLLIVLVRPLSGPETLPPPAENPMLLLLPAVGCVLLFLAGAMDVYQGLGSDHIADAFQFSTFSENPLVSRTIKEARISALMQSICGLLLLGGTAGLLCLLSLFRPGHTRKTQSFRNEQLLLAPVALTVRMVAYYRRECVNPILASYFVSLAALVFLSAGFFSLISFQFRQGSLRRLAFFTACAVVFSLCSLADFLSDYLAEEPWWPSAVPVSLGGSLALLGFLLLFLWREEDSVPHGNAAPEAETSG